MELREAIEQLATIQKRLAATERLRCLSPQPVALTGLLALVAALAQLHWIEEPLCSPRRYVALWCGTALAGAALTGCGAMRRAARCTHQLTAANARVAAAQFAPSLLAGAIVTWFVLDRAPQSLWLLPGLWQLLFGLGNLAAHRLLPRPAAMVGVLFLVTGTSCLSIGPEALDPWAMGLPFALGQWSLAAILWRHGEQRARDGR